MRQYEGGFDIALVFQSWQLAQSGRRMMTLAIERPEEINIGLSQDLEDRPSAATAVETSKV
jgi:hypothetical protein